jgi:hypothetical protein
MHHSFMSHASREQAVLSTPCIQLSVAIKCLLFIGLEAGLPVDINSIRFD